MDAYLRREGEVWAIHLGGRVARVRTSRGVEQLAVLLARPGVEVHALELVAGDPTSRSSNDAAPLLDERARIAYRDRLRDLASDLEEAESFNDRERSARIQAEIDALVDQLTSATGLGGRDRGTVTDAERARVAVRRSIKSALDRIADAHRAAGDHLAATIRTGVFCSYVPDPASPVRWSIGEAPPAAGPSAVVVPSLERPVVVGRSDEQAELLDAWRAARGGRGRVVVLRGEPGIGKTTLLLDLAAQVAGDDALVLRGRCDDQLSVPYQPVIEALRSLVAADGADVVAVDAGAGSDALSSIVPELGWRAGSAPGEVERLLLFDAVARVLRAAAARRPLLLALDDLHWATAPTLALLVHVLRDIDASPMLLVLTLRDTERHDDLVTFLAAAARAITVDRIDLTGLDADAAVALGAEADEAKRLVEHTGGNPFFLRALLDARPESSLPPSVLDVVADRVGRLSDDARRLALLTAVAGERVDSRVAVALGSVDAVDELIGAGLLVEDGTSVAFPHALVRLAIVERASGIRRSVLHADVARVLEEQGGAPAQLLHHHAEAGHADAAARWARAAAGDALRAYAFEEAISHAERGRAFADPDSADAGALDLCAAAAHHALGDVGAARTRIDDAVRIADELHDWRLLADAALEWAHTTGQVGVYDSELAAVLRRAIDRLGDTDDHRRAVLLARLAAEESASPGDDHAAAPADAAEALDLARDVGDDDVLMRALRSMFVVHDGPDDLDLRAELARELDDVAGRHRDLELQVFAKGALATVAVELGDMPTFDDALEHLHRIARRTGILRTSWYDLELQVVRAVIAGDLDEAEELANRELETGLAASVPNAIRGYSLQLLVIRNEQGRAGELVDPALEMANDPDAPANVAAMAALACVGADRHDEALELVRRVPLEELRRDTLFLGTVCGAAEVASAIGDVEVARRAYNLLLPYAGICCTIALGTISIGPTDRYLACAANASGEHSAAEAHLDAAIALDERMGARRWLERDRAELAVLHNTTTRG